MLDFEYYSPTRLIVGHQKEKEAGRWAKFYGATRVLVHYGSGSVVTSGLLDRVCASLAAAGLHFQTLGGVVPNPRDTLVYEGIRLCKQEKIDFVLAVGGGSVLDSSKAISIGSCDDGDFWDFYVKRRDPVRRLGLGTIITLPATGSEASNSSVIKRDNEPLKRGLRSDLNRPDFSIINPELTYTLPPFQTACGASDILSHVMERYFTRTTGVGLSDRLCEAVMKTVLDEAPRALAEPDQYDVRANLFWASTQAHIGLLGMGRQEDWSVHALEHELSGNYNTAHGAGLAVLYPAWLMYLLPQHTLMIAQWAERVMGVPMDFANPEATGRAGIQRLAKTFAAWGLPTTLQEMGVPRADLPVLTTRAKRNADGTCGFFGPLLDQDIRAIYELAWTGILEQ